MKSNINILVIDDETLILKALERTISDAGYTVKTMDDGEKALKLLSEYDFDIAIVDIKMPGISGMEVLKRAKEIKPELEVIMMTAYGKLVL